MSPAYRWAVLAAGTFAASTMSAAAIGLPVLAPEIREDYGLTLSQTGAVLAAGWIGTTLTLLPWGLLADRVGERIVLSLGVGACGVFTLAAGRAPNAVVLFVLLALAGASGASANSASGRAVMHWFAARQRGVALGIRQAAIPIGGAFASLTLPSLDAAGGLEAAFAFLAVLAFLGAAAGWLVVRDRPGPAEVTEATVPWTLRDRRLWLLCWGSGLYLVAQIAVMSFVVLFLHDARGVSTARAAGVLAAIQLAAIGMRIAAGRWSDVLGARIVPLRRIGLAVAATLAVAAALADAPLSLLVPAFVVAGALAMAWNGLSYTAAAELAGGRRSGAAIGFQQTVLGVVGTVAAPAFATLVDATSWRAGFGAAAVAPLLGWVLLGRVRV